MIIRRGDVYYADLRPVIGSEQGGVRPVLIIQNDVGNKYSPTTIVIPFTSELKKVNMPVHDILHKSESNGLKNDSLILGEQVRVIDKSMVLYKLGSLSEDDCNKVIGVYLRNLPKRSVINGAT